MVLVVLEADMKKTINNSVIFEEYQKLTRKSLKINKIFISIFPKLPDNTKKGYTLSSSQCKKMKTGLDKIFKIFK